MTNENKGVKTSTKIVLAVILLVIIALGIIGLKFYKVYFAPNVTNNEKYLYIKTGAKLDDLFKEIEQKSLLDDVSSFNEAATKMELSKRSL
jgi:UPF0755 protein